MLNNKTIVLGITGGIAAYKAADLASKLTQAGAKVEVVMTDAATKFITPLTLRNITRRPVVTDMFDLSSEYSVEHVALAEAADVVVIAPATANTIARLAAGIADNILGTIVLATEAPVILAPAMNDNMYRNSVTQKNVAKLKARGFTFIEPEYGRLASGKMGKGRLPETGKIIEVIERVLGQKQDLNGKRIIVTAGGTREPIDPVRHIGNRSSGKMGYALAEAARDRGAAVILITAPASLDEPAGVEVIKVKTAVEMKKAVTRAVKKADALLMAAAVADYQPEIIAKSKIKKESAQNLTLKLVKTPDILSEVKGDFIRVGFAAESENLVANAKKKLETKHLDLIVANDITRADSGFDADTNRVTIIDKSGKPEELPLMSKREVAEKILDRVKGLFTHEEDILLMVSAEKSRYIRIPTANKHLFPNFNTKLEFDSDTGLVKVNFIVSSRGYWLYKKHLAEWLKGKKLNQWDKFILKANELKKYRLETVK